MRVAINRGLSIEIDGVSPQSQIDTGTPVRHVAVLGADFPQLKPSMRVAVNDRVRLGDPVFHDRLDPNVKVVAPGSGVVVAIHRGPRRALISVVIRLEGNAICNFERYDTKQIDGLAKAEVRRLLLESGLWSALRARPFERVPASDSEPRWLFVTAMDTSPGSFNPGIVLEGGAKAFEDGIRVLARLGAEALYVCHGPGLEVPLPPELPGVQRIQFQGPHPAGLPGTHVDRLARPTLANEAWHIGYQDVLAVGRLIRGGELFTERVISVCGGGARRPRLLRTRLGASLRELLRDDANEGSTVVSGSILSGRAVGEADAFLGRFHQQVSLPEARQQRNSPWSVLHGMFKPRPVWSPAGGDPGAGLVPVQAFERVWPHRTPPVALLRALLARDTETAEKLGCLSFAEEDMALLSTVCPARLDYGAALRHTLNAIQQE
ncbi:MAG: NADH:ubiquinone reductase (Na(+)-transporting) subunit A [Xanthomonadales bacterium]|nr:NADH:ubiquinone reductase (Na(+)-transporting) subunit A [Xanthomonadales bacterium]